jgi:hypothetical protein
LLGMHLTLSSKDKKCTLRTIVIYPLVDSYLAHLES